MKTLLLQAWLAHDYDTLLKLVRQSLQPFFDEDGPGIQQPLGDLIYYLTSFIEYSALTGTVLALWVEEQMIPLSSALPETVREGNYYPYSLADWRELWQSQHRVM